MARQAAIVVGAALLLHVATAGVPAPEEPVLAERQNEGARSSDSEPKGEPAEDAGSSARQGNSEDRRGERQVRDTDDVDSGKGMTATSSEPSDGIERK